MNKYPTDGGSTSAFNPTYGLVYEESDYVDPWQLMCEAVWADDKKEFMSALEPLPASWWGKEQIGRFQDSIKEALSFACAHSAFQCAKELLESPAAPYIVINTMVPLMPLWTPSRPIHYAASDVNVATIDLLLRHGASVDLFDFPECEFEGLLPIIVALGNIHRHRCLDWTPEEHSIFRLIFILCLPQMRGALEAVKLLAENSKFLEPVFTEYLHSGHLLEVVFLLMAASDKILRAFKSSVSPGGGDTVCGLSSKGNVAMPDPARLLIKVFEKAGNKLKSYLHDQLIFKDFTNISKNEVIRDVSLLLKHAGFDLTDEDSDLSNIDCESSEVKHATEAVGWFLLNSGLYAEQCQPSAPGALTATPPGFLYSVSSTVNSYVLGERGGHFTLAGTSTDTSKQERDVNLKHCSVREYAHPSKRAVAPYHRCHTLYDCLRQTGVSIDQRRLMSTLPERHMLCSNKPSQSMVPNFPRHSVLRGLIGPNFEMKKVELLAREVSKLPVQCLPSTKKNITTLAYAMRKGLRRI